MLCLQLAGRVDASQGKNDCTKTHVCGFWNNDSEVLPKAISLSELPPYIWARAASQEMQHAISASNVAQRILSYYYLFPFFGLMPGLPR